MASKIRSCLATKAKLHYEALVTLQKIPGAGQGDRESGTAKMQAAIQGFLDKHLKAKHDGKIN
jgi:hypothetical protein